MQLEEFDYLHKNGLSMLPLEHVHQSWLGIVESALRKVSPSFYEGLSEDADWLPGPGLALRAFSLPLDKTNFVLLGESPYPRAQSANGLAFFDGAVDQIWSETGLSTEVNRATSLRNLIKAMLIADGLLMPTDTSQGAIAQVDKSSMVKILPELFDNLHGHGFLLLNASLSLASKMTVAYQAQAWKPFLEGILEGLAARRPEARLVLFGKIAERVDALPVAARFSRLATEHPYNVSFIRNQGVHEFFKPLRLLESTGRPPL